MKAVLLIHLVTLFLGVHCNIYLDPSPRKVKLISATQSSIYGKLGAHFAIDENFETVCHTDHQSAPWIRVKFQLGIVERAVVYNRLGSRIIDR